MTHYCSNSYKYSMKTEKRIVIVGASSGIGRGLAEAFASRGVKVGVAGRRAEPLKALKEKYPDMVEYETIDITHPSAVDRLSALAAKLGGMDIYVHASGIGEENPVLDPEKEVKVVETNAVGFARMISAAYGWFKKKGGGQIVAITSVTAINGIGELAAYSASKKFDATYLVAIEQLSNMEKAGICFTEIRPGWVRTPLIGSDERKPMEMTVEQVVPQIIKAIVRRKRRATIDWRWNLLAIAWNLLPDALWAKIPYKA